LRRSQTSTFRSNNRAKGWIIRRSPEPVTGWSISDRGGARRDAPGLSQRCHGERSGDTERWQEARR
jgi:hypothetical protein